MKMNRKHKSIVKVGCASILASVLLIGCGNSAQTSSHTNTGSSKISIVAAEDFYGEVAQAVGGEHVDVHSIIDKPNMDPHEYEPTPASSKLVSDANTWRTSQSAKIVLTLTASFVLITTLLSNSG